MRRKTETLEPLNTSKAASGGRSAATLAVRSWASEASNSERSALVNRNYPTADPKSRLPSRARRKWNASHRAAGAASSLVSASNTKSSRASIAGPSSRFDPVPTVLFARLQFSFSHEPWLSRRCEVFLPYGEPNITLPREAEIKQDRGEPPQVHESCTRKNERPQIAPV